MDQQNTITKNIIDFWFNKNSFAQWFQKSDKFDQEIRDNFQQIYEDTVQQKIKFDRNNAEEMLAQIIILDQFPRNMFRNEAKSFSSDNQALQLCKECLQTSLYTQLPSNPQKLFMLMPLMHSEDLEDQQMLLDILQQEGMPTEDAFRHYQVVERFGRFPFRNKVLNRPSTEKELSYMETHKNF